MRDRRRLGLRWLQSPEVDHDERRRGLALPLLTAWSQPVRRLFTAGAFPTMLAGLSTVIGSGRRRADARQLVLLGGWRLLPPEIRD
ncbi:MAG: hypothetical protein Q7T71_21035 [Herbiconiux sp.]|nr:hypothetical protein [Herbiconiux sp.]